MCKSDSPSPEPGIEPAVRRPRPDTSRPCAAQGRFQPRRWASSNPGGSLGLFAAQAGRRQVEYGLLVRAKRENESRPIRGQSTRGLARTGATSVAAPRQARRTRASTRSGLNSGARSRPRASRFIPRTSKMSAKSAPKRNRSKPSTEIRPVVPGPEPPVARPSPEERPHGQVQSSERKLHSAVADPVRVRQGDGELVVLVPHGRSEEARRPAVQLEDQAGQVSRPVVVQPFLPQSAGLDGNRSGRTRRTCRRA